MGEIKLATSAAAGRILCGNGPMNLADVLQVGAATATNDRFGLPG
jgi:hypothetical protein